MTTKTMRRVTRAPSRQPPAAPTVHAGPILSVSHARLGYVVDGAPTVAVLDASFEVQQGEKIMLLGPSGCGKSTLLKAVAGFIEPFGGDLRVTGEPVTAPGPDRAVVFQEFDQLFPWRTVRDNLVYPQRVNGRSKAEAGIRADEYLRLMQLEQARDRYPHQLSGGMKQRVAIARALALDPALLLMDEPFGALDAQTRTRLQIELNDVAARTGVTILFVTHSIQEAVFVGHRVVVLSKPPSTVVDVVDVRGLDNPADPAFTEAMQRLRGLLSEDDAATEHASFE